MEITILGVCGSPIKGGNTEALLKEALKAAAEVPNVNTEIITLAGKMIKDCIHCDWCVNKQEEGKFCTQDDDMSEIFPEILKADGLLLATPVYIGRLSGYLACFLDRWRALARGDFYRGKLTTKVAGALTVAAARNLGVETALLSVVNAFMMFGMIPIAPAYSFGSPWGACAFSFEGGMGKRDPKDKLMVLKDEYGLEGARTLGKRVAEFAKIYKAGQEIFPGTEERLALEYWKAKVYWKAKASGA